MTKPLESIIVEPPAKADACVIWLHGLGADGYDFVDIISTMSLKEDHNIRFIFPHAPVQAVTINGGVMMPAWFDIFALDLNAKEDEEGVLRAKDALFEIIRQQIKEGISPKRIALVGFSQGGALALYTALHFEEALAGVAGLSTYMPLHTKIATSKIPANQTIPLFLAHGLMDPIVPYWMGQRSLACLQGAGYNPEWHAYPIAHTVYLPECQDLGRWLLRVLYG